jgi:hypothetical protein
MISVTITMLFLVHLMGCLYFTVAKLEDLNPETWVSRNGLIDSDPFI